METFSALLAICAGNSPVSGEFPAQRPVTRSFYVFFDLRPNKRLSKQLWGWWFETHSPPLWRHSNGFYLFFTSVRVISKPDSACNIQVLSTHWSIKMVILSIYISNIFFNINQNTTSTETILWCVAKNVRFDRIMDWCCQTTSHFLTHWGRDKMAANILTTFSNVNFLNENIWISIKISLKSVPKGPIDNIPALVQIMAWRRPGDKPLSEPMMLGIHWRKYASLGLCGPVTPMHHPVIVRPWI